MLFLMSRFFNILADNDVREGLKTFSEWPTFPQLYTNGEFVGGLDIVCFLILSILVASEPNLLPSEWKVYFLLTNSCF